MIRNNNTLASRATSNRCGRGHDLEEHGRYDRKSSRTICRQCERDRLVARGQVAGSHTMAGELAIGLAMLADRLGTSKNVLINVAVRRLLEDESDGFVRDVVSMRDSPLL